MPYLQLNSISAYKVAFHLSNEVWSIVAKWNFFEKETIGKQFTRAVDSISANIAEGFGRYTKRDKVNFFRYGYGSVQECLDWNEKAYRRKLITPEQYEYILSELKKLPREINHLIKFTNEKLAI